MADTNEPWVTMKDVQEHMGVRRETISQWIAKRGMPAYKVGRQWKFKISEIDAWVRSRSADDQTTTNHEENTHA